MPLDPKEDAAVRLGVCWGSQCKHMCRVLHGHASTSNEAAGEYLPKVAKSQSQKMAAL